MRAIVAAVQRPSVSDAEFDASLAELRQLAKTLGFEVVGTVPEAFDSRAHGLVGLHVMHLRLD